MNKRMFIQPRQSGKTTAVILKYLKKPNGTLIVTVNYNSANHIKGELQSLGIVNSNVSHETLFSGGVFSAGVRGASTIILDEYMYFTKKKAIYELIHKLNPENLLIYSTSDKKYNRNMVELIRKHKETGEPIGDEKFLKDNKKEIDDLYYNFLTDPDVQIFDGMSIHNEKYKAMLHPSQYELEYENKYLTDAINPGKRIFVIL